MHIISVPLLLTPVILETARGDATATTRAVLVTFRGIPAKAGPQRPREAAAFPHVHTIRSPQGRRV